MKAKRIHILFAALVLGTTGFCQPPKNETGVFLTTDQGETWKPASKGLPNDVNISSWVVTRNNAVVMATLNYGVFKSSDGKSWNRTSQGMNIHCFHAQDNTLFAGTDKGIYASMNEGTSWTHITGDMQVNDFTETDGVLLASTNLGTLRSEDRGKSWDQAWLKNALLPAPGADSMKVSPVEGNTFRITPASPPVLLTPWKNSFRSLRENRPFQNIGLPADMSFNNILVTPFGILIARKSGGC
jgi:hypothetical protein